MSTQQSENSSEHKFTGPVVLPGEQDPRRLSLSVNTDDETVSLGFDTSVGGAEHWATSSVKLTPRLKYLEAIFTTTDLPVESVVMTWKFNAGYDDPTLAGVIIPKPNEHRVSGEKGFILTRVE